MSVVQAIWPQAPCATVLSGAAFTCAVIGIIATVLPCLKTDWISAARLEEENFSGSEVRTFLNLVPILITANLAFGALYNSMQYWYQQQACQMDLRLDLRLLPNGGQLAGSFFMIADCLAIVLATPVAVGWLNPFLDRGLRGRFNHAAKYGLGMSFGILSVVLAARFEVQRRMAPVLPIDSNCAPAGVQMSGMSAAWMIAPFFLMGVGEIYTMPVLMHFAYTRSPPSMQTLVVAINFLIGAVSNSIFTVQISALSSFVPNDLNQGRLEIGYISNIVIGISFYVAYVYCTRQFVDKETSSVP
jgi:dipeptide/tripeptide permease